MPNLEAGMHCWFAHWFQHHFEFASKFQRMSMSLCVQGPGRSSSALYWKGFGVPAHTQSIKTLQVMRKISLWTGVKGVGATCVGLLETTYKEETGGRFVRRTNCTLWWFDMPISKLVWSIDWSRLCSRIGILWSSSRNEVIVDLIYERWLQRKCVNQSLTLYRGPCVIWTSEENMKAVLADIQKW